MVRVLAAVTAFVLFAAQCEAAEKYPSQPIRIVVPFAAGGGTDVLARAIAAGLAERLGAQVYIENKPGAGSVTGTDIVAKASPDGYTLLYTSPSYSISPSLYKKLPFGPDDLVPVALVAAAPLVLALHPSVPATNIKELVALLKANPRKYNYATSGNGSIVHMASELFASMAGVEVMHIPYRGAAPAMNDVLSGQVAYIFDQVSTAAQLIDAGKLRGLAVTTLRRSALLPNVPTMDQSGYPGFEAYTWSIVLAPRGTPKEIIDRLSQELNTMVQTPEMQKRLLELGAEVPPTASPEALADFVAKEAKKWGDLVRSAGISVN